MVLKAIALGAVITLALPASAARFEFKTFYDSLPVADSEVCFLPKSLDRHGADGILATRDIRCLTADKILDVPQGPWYFYGRNSIGLIGPHRSQLPPLPPAEFADSYKEIGLELAPAAILDASALQLGIEERLFAWGIDSEEYEAPVFMLEPGSQTLMVVAGSPVIPIISANGRPVWSGAPVTTTQGKTTRLTRVAPAEGRMNVLAWFGYRLAAEGEEAMSRPVPVLEIDGRTFEASVPPGPVRSGGFLLVQFLDVPRKSGVFRLKDERWNAKPLAFTPTSAHLFLEDPLIVERKR